MTIAAPLPPTPQRRLSNSVCSSPGWHPAAPSNSPSTRSSLCNRPKGLEVQRLLLQAHLQHRGNGDVGLALCLQQQDGAVLYSHRRLGTRSLTTVFGTVELVRMGYKRVWARRSNAPSAPNARFPKKPLSPLEQSRSLRTEYRKLAPESVLSNWKHAE